MPSFFCGISIFLSSYHIAAYYNDICVGSVACRIERKEGGDLRVYVMTLGVLAPYRRLGIGKKTDPLIGLLLSPCLSVFSATSMLRNFYSHP